MPSSDDKRLADQLAAQLPPEQLQAFLSAVMARRPSAFGEDALGEPEPVVGAPPAKVRGFRARLDLVGAKPPVWRRLELPGDLSLGQLHLVIQAAMGWLDCHLHRFRTGTDHRAAYFVTPMDVEQGETGVLEDDVRLDQVLAKKGDRLWYEYDFGDGWEHALAVEEVLDDPPAQARCTAGRLACPPEDCGGIWGYTELAEWVRGGCDASSVPPPFDDAEEALGWLPTQWHPDQFDVEEANMMLELALAAPLPVAPELAALLAQLEHHDNQTLTQALARSLAEDEDEMIEADAVRLVEPFVVLLDEIGDGVQLTGAGYLPPAAVTQIAQRTGVADWWIGKTNREDQTMPVARLHHSARALGLVSVRKGRLAPTAVARRSRGQPLALWRHVVSRLPTGKTDFDRQAGWLALAVAGSGVPTEQWDDEIRTALVELGWRADGSPFPERFAVGNPTLDILKLLAGQARRGRLAGVDPVVAVTARAVIGPHHRTSIN